MQNMQIYSSVWHLLSASIVFFIGAFFSNLIAKRFSTGSRRAFTLYFWHTFFSIFYLWVSSTNASDAVWYFDEASTSNFSFGSGGVVYLTGFLVEFFGLSILGAFLFFNIFGVVGLLAFDASLRIAAHDKPKYVQSLSSIVVFLPSVSYWSSAIGKDSLSFMAAGLALWAALALSRRWLLMAFAVAVMLVVRPHIAGIMVIAWTSAIFLSRRTSILKKIFLGFLSVTASIVILPLGSQYAGTGEIVNVARAIEYIDERQNYNMEGSGGIDISTMNPAMQMFTYMFRPSLAEATSAFGLAASIENLFLLYLFIMGGWAMLLGRKSQLGESRIFMWAYGLLAWLILAMTTANLGIALRQKWMFAPMMIFLLISVIGPEKPKE
jgi:hypothetical protein